MDETDFRILGHLFAAPLDGPEAIARKVGLTRNAVSRRLRNLEEGDVLLRFFALPHNSLFGASSTVNLYAPRAPVDVGALLAAPDVIGYDLNHDGLCAATTWQQGPARPVPELDHLLGGRPVASFMDATPGPDTPHLSRLEWKVALAMLDAPRASAAALARATGLAARTCARARERLIASKAVRAGINICEDRAKGYPMFRLYVQGKPDGEAVTAILGDDAVVSDSVAEGTVYFAHARSMGAVVVAVERIHRLKGVSDVKLILSRANGIALDRLRGWCRAKIEGPR